LLALLAIPTLRHVIPLLMTIPHHASTLHPPAPRSRNRKPTSRRTQGRAHRRTHRRAHGRRDIPQQLRSSRPRPNAGTALTATGQLRECRPRQHLRRRHLRRGQFVTASLRQHARTHFCAGECGSIILTLALAIVAAAAAED
jgi:hypothetical protein